MIPQSLVLLVKARIVDASDWAQGFTASGSQRLDLKELRSTLVL